MLPACFLHASCMFPSILLLQEQAWLVHSRKHPSFSSKLNWTETHTIWPTFLGSTQEAHMGATCVLPSVASLTGRAVVSVATRVLQGRHIHSHWYFWPVWNSPSFPVLNLHKTYFYRQKKENHSHWSVWLSVIDKLFLHTVWTVTDVVSRSIPF